MAAYTRTFDVTARVAQLLNAAPWPPHPTTQQPPIVSIGDDDTATVDEQIVVRIRTAEDAAVSEWQAMGSAGRGERFVVDVWVLSSVPGADWASMWDRLAQLTDVVLAVFTNTTTGKFLPPGGSDPEASGFLGVWGGMANAEQHNQWATDEGWAGECRVAVRVDARVS